MYISVFIPHFLPPPPLHFCFLLGHHSNHENEEEKSPKQIANKGFEAEVD